MTFKVSNKRMKCEKNYCDIETILSRMCPNSSHGRLLESLCYKEFYCSVLVAVRLLSSV